MDDRTIRHQRAVTSLHFKGLRNYPASPKTLGEHLRKKRINLSLSMTQLAKFLGVGITKTAIEKWETNQNYPTPLNRIRIIEFLGFDPDVANPTGDHS
jgi:DNA-binding transcriptional regulator YiaG